ncbi:hypothetical protein D3C78_1563190 [compost metagenome]
MRRASGKRRHPVRRLLHLVAQKAQLLHQYPSADRMVVHHQDLQDAFAAGRRQCRLHRRRDRLEDLQAQLGQDRGAAPRYARQGQLAPHHFA